MKLSEIKEKLMHLESVDFQLEDGTLVPEHFHVTEVGVISKHFIDCGGTVRTEKVANFQLWDANDYEHRLKPKKLMNIIALSERVLQLEDLEVEVEYQSGTIGKYDIGFKDDKFLLLSKKTACLAKDNCGIPVQQVETSACCSPNGNCC